MKRKTSNSAVTESYLDGKLMLYPTKDDLDEKLSKYPTKDDLDEKLSKYPTKDDLDEKLSKYPTKDDLDEKLDQNTSEIIEVLSEIAARQSEILVQIQQEMHEIKLDSRKHEARLDNHDVRIEALEKISN